MKEQRNNDVVRYTLQSYIGKTIKDIDITNRQQEAVQRLCQLKNERFDDLCHDIINEIHRRSGLGYDKNNKMTDKFSRLSDQKFENLVIDTLSVFFLKNPDCKIEEMPEFLNNLKILIEDLKSDLESTSYLTKLNKLDLYSKIYEFLDLSRKKGIDKEIIKCIQTSLDLKISNESINFFEILSFPRIFLERLSDSQIFNDKSSELMEYKTRILETLDDDKIDSKERSKIIKQDLIEIMNILILNSKIPASKIDCFEDEINQMIDILLKIKKELENGEKIDLTMTYTILVSLIENISLKIKDQVSENSLSELEIHKVSLESLTESANRRESIKLVIDVVKCIRKCIGMLES